MEREQLIQGYVENSLSAAESRRLLEMVKADPSLLDEILETLRFDAGAREVLNEDLQKNAARHVRRSLRVRRRVNWGLWAAAAACLLAVVGTVVYNLGQSRRMPEKVLARVVETGSGVRVFRDGKAIAITLNMNLQAGDRVQTSAAAPLVFEYTGERTSVTVRKSTDLTVGTYAGPQDRSGKLIDLRTGMIDASVDTQRGEAPFRVVTEHARAEVKGTMFTMSASPALSRLDVSDGMVTVTDVRGNTVADVPAGHVAFVGSGLPLVQGEIADNPLLARLRTARGTADLRDLAADIRTAFEREAARGERSRPLPLLCLGLADAIVSNPKEDRQVEDVSWALARALAAANDDPDRTTAAKFRDLYTQARSAARARAYEHWHNGLDQLYRLSESSRRKDLCDALFLEFVYVTFYERGLPYEKGVLDERFPAWKASFAGRRHFDAGAASSMAAAVRIQRGMQRAIDIVKGGAKLDENGSWQAGHQKPAERAVFMPPKIFGVFQRNRSAPKTGLMYSKPRFDEAVVIGQVQMMLGESATDSRVSFQVYFPKIDRSWGLHVDRAPPEFEGKWLWFRVRFARQEDSSWDARITVWPEGNQPHDLWQLEDPLPADALAGSTGMTTNSRKDNLKQLRSSACLLLGTQRATAVWRAVGVKVKRP